MILWSSAALALRAVPASSAPPVPRVAGGPSQRVYGVAFELPAGWRMDAFEEGQVLLPPAARPGEVEYDVLAADAVVDVLDGPALDGRPLEVVVHAFLTEGGVGAFTVLGLRERVRARQADVTAILGSLRQAPVAAPGKVGTQGDLSGTWCDMSNVHANDGGRMSNSCLKLGADGSYTWESGSSWSGAHGGGGSQQSGSGTWTADVTTLRLRTGGREKVFALERRNHPRNKGDAMIVLDGNCDVTSILHPVW